MIRVRYLRSFDDSFRSLPRQDQAHVEAAIRQLLDYFSGGPRPIGLGLRKLRRHFWEIRASLDKRVLFVLEKDLAAFVLVGDHDEIKRRLKRGLR